MSRMNDLAAMLEEFSQVSGQLLDAAVSLRDMTGRLTAALIKDGDEKPKAGHRKPDEPDPKPAEPEAQPETDTRPEPDPAADPPPTKMELRALLAGLAGRGQRDKARALVAKYSGGGSFSDIDPARYRELMEEVKQYA